MTLMIDKSITKEHDGFHVHLRYALANINYGPYHSLSRASQVYDEAGRAQLDCEDDALCGFSRDPVEPKPNFRSKSFIPSRHESNSASYAPPATSRLRTWFERKLEREDLFEELCVEAEACR